VAIERRLIAAARRKAFPWQARAPRGGNEAIGLALQLVLELRGEGLTGPEIYRWYMDLYLKTYAGCREPDCRECESQVARTQRVILAALEAVASLEEDAES
jgi:hypothetical protein